MAGARFLAGALVLLPAGLANADDEAAPTKTSAGGGEQGLVLTVPAVAIGAQVVLFAPTATLVAPSWGRT